MNGKYDCNICGRTLLVFKRRTIKTAFHIPHFVFQTAFPLVKQYLCYKTSAMQIFMTMALFLVSLPRRGLSVLHMSKLNKLNELHICQYQPLASENLFNLSNPRQYYQQLPDMIFENSVTTGIFQAFCLLSYQDAGHSNYTYNNWESRGNP